MNKSTLISAFVISAVFVVFFLVGDYNPIFLTYLVIINFSYFIVYVLMDWVERVSKKTRSFHAEFITLLVGIVLSAIVADFYTTRLPNILSQYDPFWQDIVNSAIAWSFAFLIVSRHRRQNRYEQ